jgi:hypothetical protein
MFRTSLIGWWAALLLAASLAGHAQTTGNVGIGTTAYVANQIDNTLQAFSLANPASPVLLGTVATGYRPLNVAASGTTAYVVNSSNTMQAFSLAVPDPARVVAVNADGTRASVALPSGADFIRNGTSPQANASFNISGAGTVRGPLAAGSATVRGNVGVGTTAPGEKLDVAGNVRLGTAGTVGEVLTNITGTRNMLAVAYGPIGNNNSNVYGFFRQLHRGLGQPRGVSRPAVA